MVWKAGEVSAEGHVNAQRFMKKLISLLTERCASTIPARRTVIGLAGSVAAGKTTFANLIADELRKNDFGVSVVGTDGFLLPNRVLEPLGLTYVKGLPKTYDWGALRTFVLDCGEGKPVVEQSMYSHTVFDVVGTESVVPERVVIVEGVNTLQSPIADAFDVCIYLQADPNAIAKWYVHRFLQFIAFAETEPTSFYSRFVHLSQGERSDVAYEVWNSINLPNLRTHIEPSKANADVVVCLNEMHEIIDVSTQERYP
jgi:type I pantothenate kinase